MSLPNLVKGTGTAARSRRAPPSLADFLPDRDHICGALRGASLTRLRADSKAGAVAGFLCRTYPRVFARNATAELLYVLLAGLLPMNGRPVAITLTKLATWLGRSQRSTSEALHFLTLSGPLPLLLHVPGKPGRCGSYAFVRDPFHVAIKQARDADAARSRRQQGILAAQRVAILAGDAEREKRTARRRTYMTPRRELDARTRAELERLYPLPDEPQRALPECEGALPRTEDARKLA